MGDFLFGSKGKEPETTIEQRPLLTGEQRKTLKFLSQRLRGEAQEEPELNFGVAEAGEQALENLVTEIAKQPLDTGATDQAKQALAEVFGSGPTDFEEFFQRT